MESTSLSYSGAHIFFSPESAAGERRSAEVVPASTQGYEANLQHFAHSAVPVGIATRVLFPLASPKNSANLTFAKHFLKDTRCPSLR